VDGSPDTIVPDPGNPQALNRYSYVLNNPVRFVDSDGHFPLLATALIGGVVGAAIAYVPQVMNNLNAGMSLGDAALRVDGSKVAAGFVGGVVAGGTLGVGTSLGVGLYGTVALGSVGGVMGGQAASLTQGGSMQLHQWMHGHGWSNDALLQSALDAGFLDVQTMAFDALGGGVSAGVGYGLQKIMSPILSSLGDQVFEGGVPMIRLLPANGTLRAQIVLEGRAVNLSASDLENIMKGISAGSYDVVSEILQQLIDAAVQEWSQQTLGITSP